MVDKLQINTLRAGQNQDYWAAVEIMQNTFGSLCSQVHNLYSKLENIPRTYVAKVNTKVVGGLIWKYYPNLETMQLEFVAVDPMMHGKDIGSKLVGAFEDHVAGCVAKQAEVKKLILDANHTNYLFFEKLGWNFVDGRPTPEFWGPVEMTKRINKKCEVRSSNYSRLFGNV